MRAIARSCEAGILACVFLSCLPAGTHEEVVDLFASMAAALAEINVAQFMDAFDKDMTGYDKLKTEVTGLVRQADLSSSVEPLKDEGNDSKRTVELDWILEIRSLVPDGPLVRRRQIIRCELRKDKKRWKIVSLTPIEFFAPPQLDR